MSGEDPYPKMLDQRVADAVIDGAQPFSSGSNTRGNGLTESLSSFLQETWNKTDRKSEI